MNSILPKLNAVASEKLRRAINFQLQSCGVHEVGKGCETAQALKEWIVTVVGPLPECSIEVKHWGQSLIAEFDFRNNVEFLNLDYTGRIWN